MFHSRFYKIVSLGAIYGPDENLEARKVFWEEFDHCEGFAAIGNGDDEQMGVIGFSGVQELQTHGIPIVYLEAKLAQQLYLAGIVIEKDGLEIIGLE